MRHMRSEVTYALVAAVACALLSSSAFSVARGVCGGPASPQRFLHSPASESAASRGWQTAACAVVAAGLAVGLVATTQRRLSLRAVAEPQLLPGGFANGLVGTEYHGWGKYEFDPLELAERYPEHLPWYRESELKHGRVAMLAMVGLVVPDVVRLPFEQCQQKDLDFVNAHNKLIGPGLGEGPMWWLLIFCSVFESFRFRQLGFAFEKLTLENAGELGFGLGFLPKTEEGIVQMKIKELKNGRLAMLAFGGAITAGISWDVHHFPFLPTASMRLY